MARVESSGREVRTPQLSRKSTTLFTLLGIGCLFFFNIYLTILNFFSSAYPGRAFEVNGTACYTTFLFIALLLAFLLERHVASRNHQIITASFLGITGLHIILFISAQGHPDIGFYIGCASLAGIGALTGLTQSLCLQLSSCCEDPQATISVLFGQGIAGIVALVLGILVMFTNAGDRVSNVTASIMMGISGVFTLLCPFFYRLLLHDRIVAEALSSYQRPGGSDSDWDWGRIWVTIKRSGVHMWNACGVFICTFVVFPSIIQAITSHHAWIGTAWVQVIVTASFQIGDVIGRYLPKVDSLLIKDTFIWVLVLMRFVLVPLFCSFARPVTSIGSILLKSGLMVVFGITNGWFSTLACVYGPTKAHVSAKGLCGSLMALSVVSGIMIGSWLAHVVQNFVCNL